MIRRFFLMNNADAEGVSGSGGDSNNEADKGKQDSGNSDAGKNQDDNSSNTLTLDEAQKMIKSLRSENAKHRTEKQALSVRLSKLEDGLKKVTGGDDEKETPEEKLSKLSEEAHSAHIRNAMLELAVEHGVSKDDYEFFEFSMMKRLDSLEEGEELSEEDFTEILVKVKKGNGQGNTSVGGGDQKNKDPKGSGAVTVEQFTRMGMIEKSRLYNEKPEVYNSLMKQAREKKLI